MIRLGGTEHYRPGFSWSLSNGCIHITLFKKRLLHIGFLLEQKIIATLRMLAYGASVNMIDEITRVGESTVLEARDRFYNAIKYLYTTE